MIDPQSNTQRPSNRVIEYFKSLNTRVRLVVLLLLLPTTIITLIATVLVIFALVSKNSGVDSWLTFLSPLITVMGALVALVAAFQVSSGRKKDT